MRFFTISILLGSLLLFSTTGCQKATIRCQRETALLRAEILDLEDKYYALKSQHESVINGTSPMVVTNNVVGSGLIQGTPVVGESWPIDGQVISGDVIYEDQMVGGLPMLQAPVEGEVYYEGQTIYDGQTLPMSTDVSPGMETIPTPAPVESSDLNLENPPATDTTTENEQTLLLPEASGMADTPALEVGFDELELNLSSDREVDRIEIVPSATRGKDLDGVAGHDGIELMIQTINSDGEPVAETGELTVTVSDQLVGEIGKWTFLPKELQLFQSRDELGNTGTLLHLPFTDRIPVSKRVEIRVSMMIGSIQYIATQQIKIKPPTGHASDNAVVGWTASDDRWLSELKSKLPPKPSVSFQSGAAKAPATAVQRPQWKPVR